MIPHKLRLRNFLSYRDGLEPLDFSGMHLACLIGENGHGKSALLDAMTWALWGRARAASDDDLMHAGSDEAGAGEMLVEFQFGLGGQRFNVVRKRLISGRTKKSELEMLVWDEADRAWQPITEPTLRATQARIDALLRMDYETFVNSAFLKQGEADAFSRKSPGQRKEILARILNLEQYDLYAERAKTIAKDADADAAFLAQQLQQTEAELNRRPEYEEGVRTATITELQARLQREDAAQRTTAARVQVQSLADKQAAQAEYTQRLQRALTAHEATAHEVARLRGQLQKLEALIGERQAITDGHEALQQARTAVEQWNQRLAARRPLELEQQRWQREAFSVKTQLEEELKAAQRTLAEKDQAAAALPRFAQDAASVGCEIERLGAVQTRLQAQRERLAAVGAERTRHEQEKKRVETEGVTLRGRLDMLHTGEAATCPVCRQPLSPAGLQHLEQEYADQLAVLRSQVRDQQEQIRQLDQEEAAAQTALRTDERDLRPLQALHRQAAEIATRLHESRTAAALLPELQTQVQALALKLSSGDYAPAAHARLAALAAQMAALAYDEAEHARARATVSDLSGVERKYVELEGALAQIDEVRGLVAQAQQRWQTEETQLAEDRQRLQQLQAEAARLTEAQTHLRTCSVAEEQVRRDWEAAHGRLAAAQQRLEACMAQESAATVQRQRLGLAKARAARYRHLQEAFGPRGVQAMIIEAALPELETEANLLLARLSDGRMSVRLETQKGLKSGGVRETLDIILSDELGSRPYELYSGGEAFRADLALRIALSRLLARRAGAALQTLFIDEGFGTQDAHGRENLVEAIHMIKDEFALVLVITHIDELKDQFPVRIQVVKEDGRGSRYAVV